MPPTSMTSLISDFLISPSVRACSQGGIVRLTSSPIISSYPFLESSIWKCFGCFVASSVHMKGRLIVVWKVIRPLKLATQIAEVESKFSFSLHECLKRVQSWRPRLLLWCAAKLMGPSELRRYWFYRSCRRTGGCQNLHPQGGCHHSWSEPQKLPSVAPK